MPRAAIVVARRASASAWQLGAALLSIVAAVGVALRFGGLGDYPQDAQASVDALARGDLAHGFSQPALMGPVSIVLRAPFVALAHAVSDDGLTAYRVGAAACLVAVGVLVAWVGTVVRRPQQTRLAVALVVGLAILNPASVAAVAYGHPEEALCAALCVAAVVFARYDRSLAAAILLGLAVATKQWAVIAVAPAFLAAAPGFRLRLGSTALGVALVATMPALLADPVGFGRVSHTVSDAGQVMTRSTWWFPLAEQEKLHLAPQPGVPDTFTLYHAPDWLGMLSHPLIVLLTVPLALLVYRRRGPVACREGALALLALLFLLRCTLDPVDNAYYHLPLLLALLAWETLETRRELPVVTILTATVLWLSFDIVEPAATAGTTAALYGAWTVALFVYLVGRLGLRSRRPSLDYATSSRLRLRSQ